MPSRLIVALIAVLSSGSAFAADCPKPAPGAVPTGCQVEGSSAYYMPPGTYRPVQVTTQKTAAELLRRWRTEPVDSQGKGDTPGSK